MKEKSVFSTWLQSMRQARGWTQEQFAEQLEWAYTTVRQLENKRPGFSPRAATLDRCAKVLNIRLEDAKRAAGFEQGRLTTRQEEILTGLMLGDGSFFQPERGRNPSLIVTRSLIDREYQEWCAQEFVEYLTPNSMTEKYIADSRTGKVYGQVVLRTGHHHVFRKAFNLWYAGGGKRVPEQLNLSKLSMAVWFADDGCIRNTTWNALDIKFATQGFPESDVHRLKAALEKRYGAEFRVYTENGRHCTIRGFTAAARAVLLDIDDVFPPLSRKSDVWRADGSRLLTDKKRPQCIYCGSNNVYFYGRSRKRVQQFHCNDCHQAFRDRYERGPRGVFKEKT